MRKLNKMIMQVKYLRAFCGAVCFSGIIGFLLSVNDTTILSSGIFSIGLMIFGATGIKLCNIRIEAIRQALRRKTGDRTSCAKIIEFKNIA